MMLILNAKPRPERLLKSMTLYTVPGFVILLTKKEKTKITLD
jgi:hypothetical protein